MALAEQMLAAKTPNEKEKESETTPQTGGGRSLLQPHASMRSAASPANRDKSVGPHLSPSPGMRLECKCIAVPQNDSLCSRCVIAQFCHRNGKT